MNDVNSLCLYCMNELEPDGSCAHCGQPNDFVNKPPFLPAGTILGDRYVVGRVLSYSGEGVIYLGFDQLSKIKVFVKEYMPEGLCERREGLALEPLAGRDTHYKALLSDFIDLAKTLRRLDRVTAIVKVLDIFSANNTAYCVFEYLSGITYERFLERYNSKISYENALELLLPLLYSIRECNRVGIVHRGISTKTIYMEKSGTLKLFGFCIPELRTTTGELTHEIFPGYAAPEQYSASGWHGTWTDVYAIGAVFYRTLTGFTPEPANDRAAFDNITKEALLKADVPENAADAIIAALVLDQKERIQTVDEFIKLLTGQKKDTISTTLFKSEKQLPQEPEPPRRRGLGAFSIWLISTVVTGVVLAGVCVYFLQDVLFAEPSSSTSSISVVITSQSSIAPTHLVPNFEGQIAEQVIVSPEYQGMFEFVLTETNNDTYPSGVVCGQSPIEKSTIETGGKIVLQVSTGPKKVEMPNLVGNTLDEATDALDSRSIAYEVVVQHNSGQEPGYVLRTSVAAGELVTPKEEIIFVWISG